MLDECLLELYRQHLTENARRSLKVIIREGAVRMETIMTTGGLTTQQTRRGVWGLDSTGLIDYRPGRPIRLSGNGERLAVLLAKEEASR